MFFISQIVDRILNIRLHPFTARITIAKLTSYCRVIDMLPSVAPCIILDFLIYI